MYLLAGPLFLDISSSTEEFVINRPTELFCNVTGDVDSEVQLSWLKDGIPPSIVMKNVSSHRTNETVYSRLHFLRLTFTDSGLYTCNATRHVQNLVVSISMTVTSRLRVHLTVSFASQCQSAERLPLAGS